MQPKRNPGPPSFCSFYFVLFSLGGVLIACFLWIEGYLLLWWLGGIHWFMPSPSIVLAPLVASHPHFFMTSLPPRYNVIDLPPCFLGGALHSPRIFPGISRYEEPSELPSRSRKIPTRLTVFSFGHLIPLLKFFVCLYGIVFWVFSRTKDTIWSLLIFFPSGYQ